MLNVEIAIQWLSQLLYSVSIPKYGLSYVH